MSLALTATLAMLVQQAFATFTRGVVPVLAPPIGAETVVVDGVETPVLFALSLLTLPFNLAQVPALSVPCGFTTSGLPIGLQIVGRPFDEATVLRAAYAFEQEVFRVQQ